MIMQLRTDTGICESIECQETEAGFYKALGEWMSEKQAPLKVDVIAENGETAGYMLVPSAGNKFIREEYNSIRFSDVGVYPTVYLTKIDPKWNNYKFYQLEQVGDKVIATYGRIGSNSSDRFGRSTHTYESRMYYIKLSEKLAKGYIDQSKLFLGKEAVKEEKAVSKNTVSSKLYSQLLGYAKNYVEKNIVSSVVITEEMVNESKKILSHMNNLKTVPAFNRWLEKLLVVCPRRIDGTKEFGVQRWLARSKNDFASIIEREGDLIDSMDAVSTRSTSGDFGNDFEIFLAKPEQKEKVVNRLNPQLQSKVKNVYRVIPKAQKEKFNRYIKEHKISHIKELWHGSRNCNWLSIIKNSLQLNPNAQITGKMFGQGIYFAPQSLKSWGYTSYYGTRWAGGNSNTAFMGLYAVAYGKPFDVTTARPTFTARDLGPYNCVHAHAGMSLLNDEIIFYDEGACLLNYIVEFEG